MKTRLILALLLGASPLLAQEFRRTGTAGFVFLELPVSARSAALAEATTAFSDVGAEGIFQNPSAIGFLKGTHSATFSYAPWIADINHFAAGYAYATPVGVFAVGAVAVDFGSMPRTVREPGQTVFAVTGEFEARALAAGLTYANRLTEQFSFGLTAKYASETIDTYTADNIVFDGGVLYHTGLGSLRIAGALQNFGTDARYISDPFRMPAMLRIGMAGEVFGEGGAEVRLTASAEALHPTDGEERINTGLEAAWRETVVLRAGYKFLYDEESFSLGIGITLPGSWKTGFDVAYADYGRLGGVLRFTLHADID